MNNKYLKNVVTLKLIREKCTGCGICLTVCPQGVFKINDNKAEILDINDCMECGACSLNCPFSAILVNSGTGCAYAIIVGKLTGSEPNCCGSKDGNCC